MSELTCKMFCTTHKLQCRSDHQSDVYWSNNEHYHRGWSIFGNVDCKWVELK